jgi:ribosomal protein L31
MNKNQSPAPKLGKDEKMPHPEMNLVKIIKTNGKEFQLLMNAPAGSVIRLSVDDESHPAWQGSSDNRTTTQAQKFRDKYNKIRQQ